MASDEVSVELDVFEFYFSTEEEDGEGGGGDVGDVLAQDFLHDFDDYFFGHHFDKLYGLV